MEINESTTFEEQSIKDLHTLDPFLHTVHNSKQSIRNKFTKQNHKHTFY
jgi:hypothetical protein